MMPHKKISAPYPQYLLSTDWLAENLNHPNIRIFDCTAIPSPNPDPDLRKKYPLRPLKGLEKYLQGHIPGASFIDFPGTLADPSSDLPLMMPAEHEFIRTMADYGISDQSLVVLYSVTSLIWPTRVWWMLRAIGFDNAVILNGGFSKWVKEGRPVSQHPSSYPVGNITLQNRARIFVNKDNVRAALDDPNVLLVHALSENIFSGKSGPVFGRKGRIPGSVNIPSGNIINQDNGTFLPATSLKAIFDHAGIDSIKHIISYCGGGINASAIAFALTFIGYKKVAVYDGSMCEWGNDPSLPIETG